MSSIEVPGARLNYRATGRGTPLVLVHGSATDLTVWDVVAGDLARDHHVVVYDRRGYGASKHTPVRDHRLHAQDLQAVLEQVVGVPATVVGWSSGGNITLAVAVARPELFRNVVIVEAPFHGMRHADRQVLTTAVKLKLAQARRRPDEAAETFLRFGSALRSGGNSYDRLEESQRAHLRSYADQVLAEWDPHPFGVMHEHIPARAVAAIPCPLTWILGGESSPWMARLQARVASRRPDLRTVVIPGAGHLVHLDRPEEFVRALREVTQFLHRG